MGECAVGCMQILTLFCVRDLSKSPLEEVRVQGADGLLLTELLGKWEAFLHGAL